MKKIFFTLLITILTVNSFAQTVSYGLKGGLNLAKQIISPKIGGERENLVGYHIGALIDVDFGNVSIQPGLQYSLKGWQQPYQLSDGGQQIQASGKEKYKFNYIQMPVNVLYNIKAYDGTKVFLGGGPYIAYAISAKAEIYNLTYKIPFGDDTGFKRADYGLVFTAGLQISGLLVSIDADLGLANLTSAVNTKVKNNVLGLSVGYMFR